MSIGNIPITVPPTTDNKSDDLSSSSESIFNKSTLSLPKLTTKRSKKLSTVKNTNHKPICTATSQSRLADQVSHQQSEIINLNKFMYDLQLEFDQLKSVVNSARNSPTSLCQSTSIQNYQHQSVDHNSAASPAHIRHHYDTRTSIPIQSNQTHTSTSVDQLYYLQEALQQSNIALARRDIELDHLRKEIDELRYSRSTVNKSPLQVRPSSITSTHIPSTHSNTSAFIPIGSHSIPPSIIPTAPVYTSPSTMPFTMTLNNTLPNFGGKETELPIKFIKEFEVRASGLVGYNDDYLLRAVQQTLSDSALTWFIQIQQEQSIVTWSQFKILFLRRFRTPEKIELFRNRLRSSWQGDTESTADYYERLKALISEIDPDTSSDYLKRKFLQKLRKDIRDKISLGLTSPLSDLVQKATEIESSLIQQKIDDKLRAAHKDATNTKTNITTINHLSNISQSHPSSSSTRTAPTASNNYSNNSKYNTNDSDYSHTHHSRTFTNSARLSPRYTQLDNDSSFPRSNFNRHFQSTRRDNNKRWCSFCSSTSHTWSHCYSNPRGPYYQPEQEDLTPTSISSSHPSTSSSQPSTSIFSSHPTSSLSPPSPSSTLPFITSSELISNECINTNPRINSSQTTITSTIPSSTTHSTSDRAFNSNNNIFINSSSASYLIAEAKINDISCHVLLDTGSGLTIISSRYWSLIGDPLLSSEPYHGPDIHGPDGSSIFPVGLVEITITIAGVIIQHKAVLAQNFEHLILLGNDFMKLIGLVLDIQANKMWLRSRPDLTYTISSDLSNASRMEIPLLSTQTYTIPSFHFAFIQVKTPSTISSDLWEASVTGVRRHVIAANSLVRIKNQCCLIQVANLSSKSQVIYPGERLAIADLYEGNDVVNADTHILSTTSLSTTSPSTPSFEDSSNLSTTTTFDFLTNLNLTDTDITSSHVD
ncbi:unnamed protein product [Adineta steineri]|uniref:Retrotransposon gag domain-containing protein n=1 Tax=Adineta steineri TaxID=433720 RepID=A0A819UDB7_9BILA|nr:unnamed protein product [Adineta steineri]CAF4093355.1 unnamed protein product [Adineta steineri]